MAILDSGCTKTVCGQNWVTAYLDTLSLQDKKTVKRFDSANSFRFGDGRTVQSLGLVHIPVYIGSKKSMLSTDIVHCDIPLLMSRDTLHKSSAIIDFKKNTVSMFGESISITLSSSGHYCLPLTRKLVLDCKHTQSVLVNFKLHDKGESLRRKVLKLHRQFAHPYPDRLINLLKDSGVDDKSVFDVVKDVSTNCETCKRYKKSPLRPVVGFPLASTFNEVVAVDLKSYGENIYIFHMIDHLSRFSAACLIRNKQKGTIVKGFINHWFKLFGSPNRILCDNGGEFINNEVSDLCEKLNIELKSTAAESAWSNGMVERHNGILANMIDKILSDVNCDLEIALSWSIAAKNALNNVFGFSPNVLVFGRNPNLPNILINKPPANNPISISKYLCESLNAMQAAREAFIQQESSEKLKRAILRKTRGYSDQTFQIGDMVYFRRDDNVYWHGPAKIIGHDNKTFLLKVNGLYVRVHACRLQHVSSLDCSHKELANNNSEIPSGSGDIHMPSSKEDQPTPLLNTLSSDESDDETTHISQDDQHTDINSSFDDNGVINVRANKDLPTAGSKISFKLPLDNEWRSGTVINRGGKASTASWHFLNIKEGDGDKCLSFKDSMWKADHSTDITSSDDLFLTENHDEGAAFDIAKNEELQKWVHMKVYEPVVDIGQSTISCRWVLTKKIKKGNIVYKARLVARGFEEDTLSLKTDSPTCCKDTLRLVFSLLSANRWSLHSIDIKSAFLQGLPLQREVYLKPPKCAKTTYIWKLLKSVYGLADAGRHWYLRVKKVIEDLGARQSKFDKSLFIWRINGKTAGVIAVHVDDFIYGGMPIFLNEVIKNIF